MNQHNYGAKRLDLELSAEQFDTLISWFPSALKKSNTKTIVLRAYYVGEEYGIVHVTSDHLS